MLNAEMGSITEHAVEVLETWSPTPTTRAVRLTRPRLFDFHTSQAVRFIVRTPDGEAARPMSIASGPARPYLEFAARRSDSDFKRAFFALAPGDRVRLVGPRGSFLLQRTRPALLVAGGIGITPFRSMLQALADEPTPHAPVRLVYVGRATEEIAFRDEIDELARRSGVEVIHSAGRAAPGFFGRLVSDRRAELVYLAGPAPFVRAVGVELLEAGVDRDSVRMEMFRGYTDDDGGAANGDLMVRPPGPPSWDAMYRSQRVEQLPWYHASLDPDLARAMAQHGVSRGRFLDVGTGPGTQAIRLAERGFAVTGADVSAAAIEGASARAREAGAQVDFVVDDVLDSKLTGSFDYLLDRGCFHVLPVEQRAVYVDAIASRLRAGGLLFLKCFSDEEQRGGGPYHFAPVDITRIFASRFDVVSVEHTIIQGALSDPPRALFCVLRRR